jgi:hypothetical protein
MHVLSADGRCCAPCETVLHTRKMWSTSLWRPVSHSHMRCAHHAGLSRRKLETNHWQRSEMATLALPRRAVPRLTEPASSYQLDIELWEVLDMASDEELERIHDVLYGMCVGLKDLSRMNRWHLDGLRCCRETETCNLYVGF